MFVEFFKSAFNKEKYKSVRMVTRPVLWLLCWCLFVSVSFLRMDRSRWMSCSAASRSPASPARTNVRCFTLFFSHLLGLKETFDV